MDDHFCIKYYLETYQKIQIINNQDVLGLYVINVKK